MNKTWIVAAETYLRQVKSWSFVILVLSPFLLLGISLGVGYMSASSSSGQQQVAVISEQPTLRKQFIKQNSDDVNGKVQTIAAAKKQIANNKLAGYLVLSTDRQRVTAVYHSDDTISSSLKTQVSAFLAKTQQTINVQNAKLSAKQLTALSQQPTFKQKIAKQAGGSNIAKIVSFWIIVVMIYMILITYSSVTAQEIASEKGTKIMEIIFSSTTAAKYFYGKIIGVVMVIFTQILVYLVGGIAFFEAAMQFDKLKRLIDQNQSLVQAVITNLLNVNLLFAFLGVVIYTIIAAFSGALVAKAEDAAKAAQPVTYLSMLAFFVAIPFEGNSDALVAKILSYIPFFSSYFMPLRVINGNASGLEISLSIIVLIVTIGLLMGYISRIYEGLILQTDDTSFYQRFKRGLRYQQ
ncbi:ABC transporter permease [Lentilactobacillus fungorum]|uniref:ABC transporter permease n=1 Tax=Lentilactobacillus fungorum TaxID=2201250 RepID=A0ABQ3VWJ2_9LACO|nr:ABC transporter permease [Lentilactobacillus fungorum]GHP13265.1 ABC transporter permease [Lentilactobacillus fungorum]